MCDPFRYCYGPSMSDRGHCRWWRLPSSSITTFSWTCRCQKCTHMAVRVVAWPLHPSTEQDLGPAFSVNAILYVLGSSPLTYLSPSCPGPPFSTLWWFWWCAVSETLAKYLPHSGQQTCANCLSLYILPAPIIRWVWASSVHTPSARHRWQTTHTFFRTLFFSSNRSKSSVSVSNAVWGHYRSINGYQGIQIYTYICGQHECGVKWDEYW